MIWLKKRNEINASYLQITGRLSKQQEDANLNEIPYVKPAIPKKFAKDGNHLSFALSDEKAEVI